MFQKRRQITDYIIMIVIYNNNNNTTLAVIHANSPYHLSQHNRTVTRPNNYNLSVMDADAEITLARLIMFQKTIEQLHCTIQSEKLLSKDSSISHH